MLTLDLLSSVSFGNSKISGIQPYQTLVLATGRGNLPVAQIWTAKTGPFGSRQVQKPDALTVGRPNPDLDVSTHGFRQDCIDTSIAISGSAICISHLWTHLEMLLLIVKYWHWYITVHFQPISRPDVHNQLTHMSNQILTISVNRVSLIFGLASFVIWVVLNQNHP